MDQIPENWLFTNAGVGEAGQVGDGLINDGASSVGTLTNERLCAGRHVGEIVGNQEKFDSGLVGILDNDLQLTNLWDAI